MTDAHEDDYPMRPWWPEKARLFSAAYVLTMAWDSMDPTLIAVAEWFRDRARRAFLVSFYTREAASG